MTPFGIRKRLKSLLGLSVPTPPTPDLPRFSVRFSLPDGSHFEAEAKKGDSLARASGRGAAPIATGCADSSCGTCQVEVLAGTASLSEEDASETRTKQLNRVAADRRLGCRAEVLGPGVHVRIINVYGEDGELT